MEILLIKPRPHRRSINLQRFMICEPLELEYAAAVLEQDGHSVDIVDMVADKRSFRQVLMRKPYAMVAFTAYINLVGIVKQYAATVKRLMPDAVTVVGGVHAEVVPTDFDSDAIDCVLHRNALDTIVAVVRAVDRGERGASLREIVGVYGAHKVTCPHNMTFQYPHPLRHKTAAYRAQYNYIYHDRCALIKTSFGCPYRCEFCFCTQVSPYFTRPLDDVLSELSAIEEENVFIVDDDFLVDNARLTAFCEGLQARGIHKTFIAFARADFIAANEPTIAMLAQNGFDAFFVGLESFRTEELDDYHKRTTVMQNVEAVRVLERNGMQCYSGMIVSPDWTKRDFDGLIRFLNAFSHPMVNIQPLTPMPGTPVYDKLASTVTTPRTRYELWDMAHAVYTPDTMSKRALYYHILRAYLRTSASKKGRRYIRDRYGIKVYRRVRRGACAIAWQYLKLILFPS